MKKWNKLKHEYEDYSPPADGRYLIYSDNMDEICNCPACGKTMTFGEGYASMVYFSDNGVWSYTVCKECNDREWRNR